MASQSDRFIVKLDSGDLGPVTTVEAALAMARDAEAAGYQALRILCGKTVILADHALRERLHP